MCWPLWGSPVPASRSAMLAMMGLLPWTATVSADRLNFDGKDLLTLSARQRRQVVGKDIAMIFQEPMSSLNPCFTVGFQLGETLRVHLGMSRAECKARSIELLDLVGIPAPEKRLSAFPHQLSGGMSQRVMIAMAISCSSKLLVADEPTTALDVTIQAQILDLLLQLQQETGMALVLITHDMGGRGRNGATRLCAVCRPESGGTAGGGVVFAAASSLHGSFAGGIAGTRYVAHAAVDTGRGYRASSTGLTGCLFSPRCAHATDQCRTQSPPRAPAELGSALCHYPLVRGQAAAPSGRQGDGMSDDIVLRASDLTKHYSLAGSLFARPATVKALDGVSFQLSRKKTLAVVGESGCGKSTLARLVTMIEEPTAGSLQIAGEGTGKPGQGHSPQIAAPGADGVSEPVRLAQSAPENRLSAGRTAIDEHAAFEGGKRRQGARHDAGGGLAAANTMIAIRTCFPAVSASASPSRVR